MKLALVALLLAGCGDENVPASELGARLFADSNLSTSPINAFSCATCHPVRVGDVPHGGPIYPGYNLFDSVYRPSWWGGYEDRLIDAINYCLVEFMGGAALDENEPRAKQLYEYLRSISPDTSIPALPLTIVKNVTSLDNLMATASASNGAAVWARGCKGCHGEIHTGEGKLGSKTSIVPEDTTTGKVCHPPPPQIPPGGTVQECARQVIVEKVRHGKFFNIGGLMPLYSAEMITDAEIADILAYLGL